jgi:hypothetical protein
MGACGPRVQLPFAAAACWLLGACAAPIAYPRSAELLDGGRTRFRLSSYTVGFADTHAQAEIEGTSDTYSDLSPARTRWNTSGLEWLLGPALSHEGGFDLSLEVCELGALGSLVRVGGELRCAVLQERWGAPFSLAASGAAFSYIQEEREGFRFGLDGSRWIAGWGPLFGAYVDYGTSPREIFDSDLPSLFREIGSDDGSISALRDEWRLAVPLGIALRGGSAGGALAIVTEYTLFARDRRPPTLDTDAGTGTVTSFDQHWAVFLTGSVWVSP